MDSASSIDYFEAIWKMSAGKTSSAGNGNQNHDDHKYHNDSLDHEKPNNRQDNDILYHEVKNHHDIQGKCNPRHAQECNSPNTCTHRHEPYEKHPYVLNSEREIDPVDVVTERA
jgi:hypothetical protein